MDIASYGKLGLDSSSVPSSDAEFMLIVIKPKNKANVNHGFSSGTYSLINEIDEALHVQTERTRIGDERGLLEWSAHELNRYVQSAEDISKRQSSSAKHKRRQE
ncbi:hypothetical protein FRC07_014590 [Ceratobasidium sp. 392]|nr:hypothetical protein FRC07_014590 [Ceratobasidium sp. 392]